MFFISKQRFLLLFSCLFIFYSRSLAQEADFHSPVGFKIYLSGSFAELRTNHFHSGIDIKTQGQTGMPVYAAESGYISRIKVQANGYGKSIYINHPSGYTSVYGHLSKYTPALASYVKGYQYKNKIHTLDIYPAKGEFPVKKGELIAFSGNTGSSGGPHLHFEMRKTNSQHPVNPGNFNYSISDHTPPRLFGFHIYNFKGNGPRRRINAREEKTVYLKNGNYELACGDTLNVYSLTGFGVESYDYYDGTHNQCGLFSIKVYKDEELYFHFQTDEFSFSESRYINALIDHPLYIQEGKRIQQLFLLPNNRLSMYRHIINNGIIRLAENESCAIRIVLNDLAGNSRTLRFIAKGSISLPDPPTGLSGHSLFQWDQVNKFSTEDFTLTIPERALYADQVFSYHKVPGNNKLYPWDHHTGPEGFVLHKKAEMKIRVDAIPDKYLEKLCIVRREKNQTIAVSGSHFVNKDWIRTKISRPGTYSIEADTIAPVLSVYNFIKNEKLTGKSKIMIRIRDDLSGIKTYEGKVDNQWVLFEYDPKNNMLIHYFDGKIPKNGKIHSLEIIASDWKKNRNKLKTTFVY